MMNVLDSYDLRPLNTAEMSRADFEMAADLLNTLHLEHYTDDPPKSLDYSINNLKSLENLQETDFRMWFLWDESRAVALVHTDADIDGTNEHALYASVEVHPEYRRHGLGTALLGVILKVAEDLQRTLILGETLGGTPSGAAFMTSLGAAAGLSGQVNQLVLEDIPRGLLEAWLAKEPQNYTLGLWQGALPEEELEQILTMMEVMNTAPHDDLNIEDELKTPERWREIEQHDLARGLERWIYYVRHVPSGELAGYTEITFNPEEPHNVWQGDTGVLPAHRGHGLGKYLKASMIRKVQTERPSIKHIRTGNADSNAPMLAINKQLGFKPYLAWTAWQVDVEKVRDFMGARAAPT